MVVFVKYWTVGTVGPARDGGYVYVFKVVGQGEDNEFWNSNSNRDGHPMWGMGPMPKYSRYLAAGGWYSYRSDCRRAARRFSQQYRVRTITICVPMPVKYNLVGYHLNVARVMEHRRAVPIVACIVRRFVVVVRNPLEVRTACYGALG